MASEWERLREVVVGRSHYRLPAALPEGGRAAVTSAVWRKVRRCEGRTMREAMPTAWAGLDRQLEALARFLSARGVHVHRVPPFQPSDERYLGARFSESSQLFPRDPLLVVGSRALELSVRDPRRRRERFPLRRLLAHVLPHGLSPVRSMPVPEPADGTDPALAFLDGGDCLVARPLVVVGIALRGASESGIAWLRHTLGRRWRVDTVVYDDAFPHLDCALGLLRPKLGILCPDAFPQGPPRALAGWRWVEVTRGEALDGMAANVLPLDERTVLMPAGNDRVARALRRHGQRVHVLPFDHVTGFAGGMRCCTQPLVRRN